MLTEYPRPQFVRDNWLNLNGEWNFSFDDKNLGEKEEWFKKFNSEIKIIVPYTYETKMSTIEDESHHSTVWYNKELEIHANDKRKLLHFEGSDYKTKVWVNSHYIGEHKGGYAAFKFDITDYICSGRNVITVKVEDQKDCLQPRGKQRWTNENFGCWYVQTTGIWKSVWIEEVSNTYLEKVKITPDIDNHSVEFFSCIENIDISDNVTLKCKIYLEGAEISSHSINNICKYNSFTIDLSNNTKPWCIALWSPQSPKLYDVVFTIEKNGIVIDKVESYFGMRKVSIENGQVLLNNRPIYQKLILDQGYWKESHLTPPSEEAIIKDIDLILEAGYNGIRKHQKIEDRRFLYWCDKKGVLVWSEMASQYSFNDIGVSMFIQEWMEIIEQNYNHPSIITWVPFNESWGIEYIYSDKNQQKFTEAVYNLTKTFDLMRPVIVNDGWEHTVSDIITLHDYDDNIMRFTERYADKNAILSNEVPFNMDRFAFADGYKYNGQPIIISEYGGIAFSDEGGWGYGKQMKDEDEFIERFDKITSSIKEIPYVCGYCYTQITDVQQEVNGLYTEERKAKVDIKKIKRINEKHEY